MNRLRGFEVVRDEFRKTEGEVKLPTRATKHSAGYDFYLPCDIKLKPHERTGIIPTDVKAYMQEDEVLLLHIRSSIGIKKGIILSNATAVIDSDYFYSDKDGNIGIALCNTTDKVVKLKKGERIMQGVFSKYLTVDNDQTSTERNGGFGSSGSK